MNQSELKAKGIDAPWSSAQLQILKSEGIQSTFSRSYGQPLPPHGNWNTLVILNIAAGSNHSVKKMLMIK